MTLEEFCKYHLSLMQLSLIAQHDSDVVVRLNQVRHQRQCLLITSYGLFPPSQVIKRVAAIIVRLCDIVVQSQRAAIAINSALQISTIIQDIPETDVRDCIVRLQRNGTAITY